MPPTAYFYIVRLKTGTYLAIVFTAHADPATGKRTGMYKIVHVTPPRQTRREANEMSVSWAIKNGYGDVRSVDGLSHIDITID